jgi:hypothetical protein
MKPPGADAFHGSSNLKDGMRSAFAVHIHSGLSADSLREERGRTSPYFVIDYKIYYGRNKKRLCVSSFDIARVSNFINRFILSR